MQGGCRVEHREVEYIPNPLGFSMDLGNADVWEPPGHRKPPQCDDHLRGDEIDLPVQELFAGGDLLWKGITVAGRTTLDDVADIHLIPPGAGCWTAGLLGSWAVNHHITINLFVGVSRLPVSAFIHPENRVGRKGEIQAARNL